MYVELEKYPWEDVISERDQTVYAKAGFGQRSGGGQRPALLIIDVQYRTAGESPKPILEAMDEYPTSCGEAAWKAIEKIGKLLDAFRSQRLPVLYAIIERKNDFDAGQWRNKVAGISGSIHQPGNRGTEIVERIAPLPGEMVFSKRYASAFFGTPLVTHLNNHRADTVVVAGCTTSGCVRASVADAFSYGFSVLVPHDAVYDRGEVSHKVNLFDMHSKYADVVSTAHAIDYVTGLRPVLNR